MLMRVLQSFADLNQIINDPLRRQPVNRFQQNIQCGPGQPFHDDKHRTIALLDVVHSNNIFVVQFGDDFGLVSEASSKKRDS